VWQLHECRTQTVFVDEDVVMTSNDSVAASTTAKVRVKMPRFDEVDDDTIDGNLKKRRKPLFIC
jgi:hypothetical protein